MPELTSSITLSVQGVNSTRTYAAGCQVTDYCAHAYVQEYQVTSAEDVTIWSTAGDPGYADFIFMRIEVLDWGSAEFVCPVSIESGSSAINFYLYKPFGVFDLWGIDVWNDASAGGSADQVDAIKILGTGGTGTPIFNPLHVRVTFYTVES